MRGLILREWLYTCRDARGLLVSLMSPLAIVAVEALVMRRGFGDADRFRTVAVYFAFYTAISFTTVNRSMKRVRAEIRDGTAFVYLLTRTSLADALIVKLTFEVITNLLALTPLLIVLSCLSSVHLAPTDVFHAVVAAIALTAFTVALSCLIRSDESYRTATLVLSMSPLFLAPGVQFLVAPARLVVELMPTLTAFEGFRSVATDLPVDVGLVGILLVELALSAVLAMWAYPRMLLNSFAEPAT
jgi:hypothetical protein